MSASEFAVQQEGEGTAEPIPEEEGAEQRRLEAEQRQQEQRNRRARVTGRAGADEPSGPIETLGAFLNRANAERQRTESRLRRGAERLRGRARERGQKVVQRGRETVERGREVLGRGREEIDQRIERGAQTIQETASTFSAAAGEPGPSTLSVISEEQLSTARAAQERIVEQARRGNVAARTIIGGQTLQRIGADITADVEQAIAEPDIQPGLPTGIVSKAFTPGQDITEPTPAEQAVQAKVGPGVAPLAGGPPFIAGQVATVAGFTARGIEQGRVTDVGNVKTFGELTARGGARTVGQAVQNPIETAVFLATPAIGARLRSPKTKAIERVTTRRKSKTGGTERITVERPEVSKEIDLLIAEKTKGGVTERVIAERPGSGIRSITTERVEGGTTKRITLERTKEGKATDVIVDLPGETDVPVGQRGFARGKRGQVDLSLMAEGVGKARTKATERITPNRGISQRRIQRNIERDIRQVGETDGPSIAFTEREVIDVPVSRGVGIESILAGGAIERLTEAQTPQATVDETIDGTTEDTTFEADVQGEVGAEQTQATQPELDTENIGAEVVDTETGFGERARGRERPRIRTRTPEITTTTPTQTPGQIPTEIPTQTPFTPPVFDIPVPTRTTTTGRSTIPPLRTETPTPPERRIRRIPQTDLDTDEEEERRLRNLTAGFETGVFDFGIKDPLEGLDIGGLEVDIDVE